MNAPYEPMTGGPVPPLDSQHGHADRGLTPATHPRELRSHAASQRDTGHPTQGVQMYEAGSEGSPSNLVEAHTPDGVPRPLLRREDYTHIPGWGTDLDRALRPAVPMERMPPRLQRVPLRQQQPQSVEVLHSMERPGITPVFGTTVPPSGVSGGMRRVAFNYSESDLRHWFMLLAADRVQIVEGLLSDLAHGHVPRVYAEMGGRAELRHNPAGAVRKAVILAAVAGIGWALWQRNRRRR